ncbi:hypothetical protein C2G38_2050714 [Gigaspora rosea]|uniref:RdRp catalytic domain-containing protein n=1 Tax=Gigaspora rosea TaxID=44941 RepID=A0A397TUZ6_9GLOM|nr:hypothetical protein C2G38_2050714 [Gigaspora rosea]
MGHSTGQSTVNPDNTIYCLTLITEAWTSLTGLPAGDFTKYNKITAYGDDNVLSSNCFDERWNPDTICDYFAKKGISLRLEGRSNTMNGVEFLSKLYYDNTVMTEHDTIDKDLLSTTIILDDIENCYEKIRNHPDVLVDFRDLIGINNKVVKEDQEFLDLLVDEFSNIEKIEDYIDKNNKSIIQAIILPFLTPTIKYKYIHRNSINDCS